MAVAASKLHVRMDSEEEGNESRVTRVLEGASAAFEIPTFCTRMDDI